MQEVVENIALEKLKAFPNHPFKIREDEAMMETGSYDGDGGKCKICSVRL